MGSRDFVGASWCSGRRRQRRRASQLCWRSAWPRSLVAELQRRRKSSGSYDGTIDHAAFAILALRATGSHEVGSTASWLAKHQNHDGGFGFAPHAGSDPDDTGSVMEALAAAGRRGPLKRAVAYLKHAQNHDGGFGQFENSPSNAQSTAFAVQGLVAAGRDTSRAVRYLASLETSTGMVRYSRSSSQTPVWVTAEALLALARKPFPFKAPGRPAQHRRAAATAAGPAHARRRRHSRTTVKPSAKPNAKAAPPAARPAAPAPRSTALARARTESDARDGDGGSDPGAPEP